MSDLPVAPGHEGASLELADVTARLDQARRAEHSHFVITMVGGSPLGLMVLVNLVMGGPRGVLWLVLFVAALVVQMIRWRRSEAEVERLEAEVRRLEAEGRSAA